MKFTTLGRTQLNVSVVGLGCGGHSRLGTATGNSTSEAVTLVQHAVSSGINFIDTAAAYGTEPIVGDALKGRRDQVVISTKAGVGKAADVLASLEQSLKNLQTDYIDIFNLHGVALDQYPFVLAELVPLLQEQQARGKIRFLGITEAFIKDPSHQMLPVALADDLFDVVMVGFNLFNPSARKTVLPLTQKHEVGTQLMFAVRRALSNEAARIELIADLKSTGQLPDSALADPLVFLTGQGIAASVVEAAYRFCVHEPGIDVVLTGTGNKDHLDHNLRALLAPPLPAVALERLTELFGHIDSVSGN